MSLKKKDARLPLPSLIVRYTTKETWTVVIFKLDLHLPIQSPVPISTTVVNSIPTYSEMDTICNKAT